MADLSWKDQLLLREMELVKTHDRSVTGPRAPLMQDNPVDDAAYWRGAVAAVLIDRDCALAEAARNRRAFLLASGVAAWLLLIAIVGWIQ
jgi:hypothetical protein